MNKPDILIFMSDQHGAMYSGFDGHKVVKTPNLDSIAQEGTTFDAAYTSCPLCVPARVSMLTGQLPSKTGVFTNNGAIREDQATFIHSLAIQGYETVLCGRMHFMGKDQRHGFTKRIMKDITMHLWGVKDKMKQELGDYDGTLGEFGCHKVVGGGNSPVLEYDRAVINAALDYLKEKHEKPQCILVGTYAPHFPYVAPLDLYKYYQEKAGLPQSLAGNVNSGHPAVSHKEQPAEAEHIKNMRAAYFGMITNMDKQIGIVHKQWKEYLQTTGRNGVFVYLSDHGDQVGERQLYGKKTFYEGASRIPMIFEGFGIQKNKRVKGAVSIMDLGSTLCDLIGTQPPAAQDGVSLLNEITSNADNLNRAVTSQFIDKIEDKAVMGLMVRQQQWKLISYYGYEKDDALFDISQDPYELDNIKEKFPNKVAELRDLLYNSINMLDIIREYENRENNHSILVKWGKMMGGEETDRWTIPQDAVHLPQK